MTAHLSTLSAAVRRLSPPPRPESEDIDRYRLQVLAPSVGEVIVATGGLICDRAMAGGGVTVSVARGVKGTNDRPLRILGAHAGTLSRLPASPGRAGAPQVLAVAVAVLLNSEPARHLVLAALGGRTADVLLWGGPCPPELARRFTGLTHRPSAAARAFKGHALAVVGAPGPMDAADERFLSST